MAANRDEMTPFERLSTVMRLGIPDRVPVVLVSSTHGARELGLSLSEYYSSAENVAEGQLRFAQTVGHDNVDAYFYAGREAQAFGSEVIFREAGPPNVGAPILSDPSAVDAVEAPDPLTAPSLQEVLRCTQLLAEKAQGRRLVIGHAVGACSLPILLMGHGPWLELLLFGNRARRNRLLQITSQFSVAWSNALLAAGADVIALAEPMASSSILTREQAMKLVFPVARRVVRAIRGPVVLWSIGAIQSVADLVPDLGARAVSTDPTDDLREVKLLVAGKLAVLGGLNDLAMLTWTRDDAEAAARRAIEAAAPGGGFVLSHQNEIPFAVTPDLLAPVVEATKRWGRYPDVERRVGAG